ncbi:MAG: endonuclease/exonuclease/phosphatase family protein [Hyphomonadaceae bacterium]
MFAAVCAAFLLSIGPVDARTLRITHGQTQAPAPDELTIITWNIGYAGLGADSEFAADGGGRVLPPSRASVARNLAGIQATLRANPADVYCIQEMAAWGPMTLWHDVRGGVYEALEGLDRVFYADVRTHFWPPPIRLVHGPGLFSRYRIENAEVVRLPDEPNRMGGVVLRRYGLVVARIAPAWTIVSLHLSAFDEGAQTRRTQLTALMDFAQREHASGRSVVLGGDFNYLLAQTDFPHTTAQEHLFWVHDFPQDALPEGWRIAADATTPSNRTNNQPYVEGENYRSVIDGFVISPDLEAVEVQGIALGFAHADHQPVRLRVRRRGG